VEQATPAQPRGQEESGREREEGGQGAQEAQATPARLLQPAQTEQTGRKRAEGDPVGSSHMLMTSDPEQTGGRRREPVGPSHMLMTYDPQQAGRRRREA
jgi:hypothetical protein